MGQSLQVEKRIKLDLEKTGKWVLIMLKSIKIFYNGIFGEL